MFSTDLYSVVFCCYVYATADIQHGIHNDFCIRIPNVRIASVRATFDSINSDGAFDLLGVHTGNII